MASHFFPPVENADEDGFLGWSPEVSTDMLVDAYSNGIFPWPQRENEILWFSPPERGVLEFKEFHIGRSLQKWIRSNQMDLEVKEDQDFESIIKQCKDQIRPGQTGTWITDDIIEAYLKLFEEKKVHCLGIYRANKLVGGIYGVYVDRYFSAESMYYLEPNVSKYAFVKLVEKLQKLGHEWVDIQMTTPVTEAFGGKYVQRSEFISMIEKSKEISWST